MTNSHERYHSMNIEEEIKEIKMALTLLLKDKASKKIVIDCPPPQKRFYLATKITKQESDRWDNWTEVSFVPYEKLETVSIFGISFLQKYYCEFDNIEDAVEYYNNNSFSQKIYIADKETDRVIAPKKVKLPKNN